MSEQVNLQFTQDDRDLLLRIDQRVKAFIERADWHERRLNRHNRRLRNLESLRTEGRAMWRIVRWMWAAIAALAGLFGLHVRQH